MHVCRRYMLQQQCEQSRQAVHKECQLQESCVYLTYDRILNMLEVKACGAAESTPLPRLQLKHEALDEGH